MKTKIIIKIILILSILIVSFLIFRSITLKENLKLIKYSRIKSQLLKKGEWISNSDSLSGISVRADKLAFFEKGTFESEDICRYEIIDSIYKTSKDENIVGEYLKLKDFKDTIYYQIIKSNDTSITLQIKKNNVRTFNLKR
jgi:hypothetical protein